MGQGGLNLANNAANAGSLGDSNELGSQIKDLIAEIDQGRKSELAAPTGTALSTASQPHSAATVINTNPTAGPQNLQEARQIDEKYLKEIEEKMSLLNSMINKN